MTVHRDIKYAKPLEVLEAQAHHQGVGGWTHCQWTRLTLPLVLTPPAR